MSNRTVRSRHLSVVPDAPLDSAAAVRRSSVVNYVLSIELKDVTPTVWRRVRVRSDLLLPEVHDVLQLVMGWGNRHLHAFDAQTGTRRGRYEMQVSLDDDGAATREDHVRIGDVLRSEGDTLVYEYDFGDGWQHTVRLEVVDGDIDDLRPLCLGGERACPVEECGGPSGYQQLLDAQASDDVYGEYLEWRGGHNPALFEVDAVNARLRSSARTRTLAVETAAASPLVARLFADVNSRSFTRLMDLLPRCELTIESSIDASVAVGAMQKLTWFLAAVGQRGIALTSAGYLPPAIVERMRDELDWGLGWLGNSTRDIDNHQVSDVRESARLLGLVRVLKGRLLLTKLGTQLLGDPVELWRHCATRLPLGRDDAERDAGTLFLISLAASASVADRNPMVTETLTALGWGHGDISIFDAQVAAQPTVRFLDLIGAHGPSLYFRSDMSDAPGWSRRFARDALRS